MAALSEQKSEVGSWKLEFMFFCLILFFSFWRRSLLAATPPPRRIVLGLYCWAALMVLVVRTSTTAFWKEAQMLFVCCLFNLSSFFVK